MSFLWPNKLHDVAIGIFYESQIEIATTELIRLPDRCDAGFFGSFNGGRRIGNKDRQVTEAQARMDISVIHLLARGLGEFHNLDLRCTLFIT